MRPTPRCLLLFAAAFPSALLPVLVDPVLWTAWLIQVGLSVLAAGVDAILGLPRSRLGFEVETPSRLYVGEEGHARIRLDAQAGHASTEVGILCDLHADLMPQDEQTVKVALGDPTEVEVPLVPLRRGTVTLERVWLRWTGPFGLMERRAVHEEFSDIAVIPSTHAVRRVAMLFDREAILGAKSVRLVGEGSEFDAMREYVPGLDHRSISWKASARHRKLVCQDFRAERNHQVIVAVDTGRLMAEPLEGVPKLDHAIHAGLAVAYTCLRTGDRVGLYAFDEKVRAYVAPQGGVPSFARLQQVSADLEYTTGETNFTLGLAELSMRLRRRTLIVLLTDFVDTVTAELMVENAARLALRHLVLFVTLRDPHLEKTVAARPGSVGALCRSVVASDFARERDVVLKRLDRLGLYTLDAPPAAISADLVSRYLEIKRRELVG